MTPWNKNRSVGQVEKTPMQLVKEGLIKAIADLKAFNERIDKEYPNLVKNDKTGVE